MKYHFSLASLLIASLALAACDKEPVGQVAAVLNDDEITLQEINAELSNGVLPAGLDEKEAQNNALQMVIDRKLLAGVAKQEGVDTDPSYIIRKRQMEDALLAKILSERLAKSIERPTSAQIEKFIADNPQRFAGHTVYELDAVQFSLPEGETLKGQFADDHSISALIERLDSMGIQYQRRKTGLDSAKLGKNLAARLASLPPGEPFLIPSNSMVLGGVVTKRVADPISNDEARPIALRALTDKALGDVLRDRLEKAKKEAKISYAEGFSEPKREAGGDKANAATAPVTP